MCISSFRYSKIIKFSAALCTPHNMAFTLDPTLLPTPMPPHHIVQSNHFVAFRHSTRAWHMMWALWTKTVTASSVCPTLKHSLANGAIKYLLHSFNLKQVRWRIHCCYVHCQLNEGTNLSLKNWFRSSAWNVVGSIRVCPRTLGSMQDIWHLNLNHILRYSQNLSLVTFARTLESSMVLTS